MEHQLFKAIVALLAEFGKPPFDPRQDFTDHDVVKAFYWAVIHDRPTTWALRPPHWPPHLRRGLRLPSDSTMSRRLRTAPVRALLGALGRRVIAPQAPGLFWMVDGKPLPVGGCSKDRQAGYGKAAGGKAKGYKLHALVGSDGAVAAWRVAPMNKDERVMAERLVQAAPPEVLGYVVADGSYDPNPLHAACAARGELRLVTPRRYGPGKGTGHRRQTEGRLHSMALTEAPLPGLGARLLKDRGEAERQFGNLTSWGGGLACLPAWVRTHRRVRRWVQAKWVLTRLKRDAGLTTCAA